MLVSAPVSGVRGFEDSLGEQYLSVVCREASIDYRAGLYALRTGDVG